ncbi:MAG: hypothetical protein AAGC97_17845 [Planctomycetota bacterium]
MSEFRHLGFETMEPRLAKAIDLDALLATTSDQLDLLNEDRTGLESHLQQFQDSMAKADGPTEPVLTFESGVDTQVRLRVEVVNANNRLVQTLADDEIYHARVFAQDVRTRPPTDGSQIETLWGGVFAATLDVEFSENGVPSGPAVFNPGIVAAASSGEAFGNALKDIEIRGTSVNPVGQSEQYLFDVPFTVKSSAQSTSIRVTPSTTTDESILVFNAEGPVDLNAIAGRDLSIQRQPAAPINAASEPLLLPGRTKPAASIDALIEQVERVSGFGKSMVSFRSRPLRIDTQSIDHITKRSGEQVPPVDLPSNTEPSNAAGDGYRRENDKPLLKTDQRNDGHGLFFDERMFLEGSLALPHFSRFSLRFRLYDAVDWAALQADDQDSGPDDDDSNAWINIAEILRPKSNPSQWQAKIDAVVQQDGRRRQDDEPMPGDSGLAAEATMGLAMKFDVGPVLRDKSTTDLLSDAVPPDDDGVAAERNPGRDLPMLANGPPIASRDVVATKTN